MNRNLASLVFVAAVFVAGCNGNPSTMGAQGSTRSAGPTSPAGPAGSPGPAATPEGTDFTAFARLGMEDPEYVEPREVNGLTFVMTQNEHAFDDWF